MPQVRYIGFKTVKTDNVALTKTIWNGNGDVQDVDEATWAKLAKHPDIWKRVEDARPKPSLADVVVNTPAPVAISDIVRKKSGPKPKAK